MPPKRTRKSAASSGDAPAETAVVEQSAETPAPAAKKRRGRPPGSRSRQNAAKAEEREEGLLKEARSEFYKQVEEQLSAGRTEIVVEWTKPGPIPVVPTLPPGTHLSVARTEAVKVGRPTRPEVPIAREDGELPQFVTVVEADPQMIKQTVERRKDSYTFTRKKFRAKEETPYTSGILKGYSWHGENNFDDPETEGKKKGSRRGKRPTQLGESAPSESTVAPERKAGIPKEPVLKERPVPHVEPPRTKFGDAEEWVPPWPVNPAHVVAKPRGANGTALDVIAQVCKDETNANRIQMVYTMRKEDPSDAAIQKKSRARRPQKTLPEEQSSTEPPKKRSKGRKKVEEVQEEAPKETTEEASSGEAIVNITATDMRYFERFTNTEVSFGSDSFTSVKDVDLLYFARLQRSIAQFDVDEQGQPTEAALRRRRHREVMDNTCFKGTFFDEFVVDMRDNVEKFVALVDPNREDYGGLPMAVALGERTVTEVMGLEAEYKEELRKRMEQLEEVDLYDVPHMDALSPCFIFKEKDAQTDADLQMVEKSEAVEQKTSRSDIVEEEAFVELESEPKAQESHTPVEQGVLDSDAKSDQKAQATKAPKKKKVIEEEEEEELFWKADHKAGAPPAQHPDKIAAIRNAIDVPKLTMEEARKFLEEMKIAEKKAAEEAARIALKKKRKEEAKQKALAEGRKYVDSEDEQEPEEPEEEEEEEDFFDNGRFAPGQRDTAPPRGPTSQPEDPSVKLNPVQEPHRQEVPRQAVVEPADELPDIELPVDEESDREPQREDEGFSPPPLAPSPQLPGPSSAASTSGASTAASAPELASASGSSLITSCSVVSSSSSRRVPTLEVVNFEATVAPSPPLRRGIAVILESRAPVVERTSFNIFEGPSVEVSQHFNCTSHKRLNITVECIRTASVEETFLAPSWYYQDPNVEPDSTTDLPESPSTIASSDESPPAPGEVTAAWPDIGMMRRPPRANLSELILQIQVPASPPLSKWNLLCLSTVTALVTFLVVFVLLRLCYQFYRRRCAKAEGRASLKSETTSSFLLDHSPARYDAV
ncbi:hypothetical protein QR680_005609 [Steinernema hermaphroditum]|uniref:Uncharacterized protein n=1 Tax=Steinernema hermaphroditum TaxID=289476 RepID=A0AA39HV10_9BILA|nr:hypothetical protein QR680_005609 [Steinernema hermaphroditum]